MQRNASIIWTMEGLLHGFNFKLDWVYRLILQDALMRALLIFNISQKLFVQKECNILYFGSCFCSKLSSENFS